MSKLLLATAAALGIAICAAPVRAQAPESRPASAKATPLQALDHDRRAWFEQTVDDILTGGGRQASHGGVLQGRSSDR